MSHLAPHPTVPCNLCEMLLRDIASLLVTSEIIGSSLYALRPECEFSRELTNTVDAIAATSEAGVSHLRELLAEAGAVLPPATERAANVLVTWLFTCLPTASSNEVLAAEITVNLRLLVQHIELKARLAAEEAQLVGQTEVCKGLMSWAEEWRSCGGALRRATVRARAHAYFADLEPVAAAQAN